MGAKLVLNGRNPQYLEEARAALAPLGSVLALQADMSKEDDVKNLIESTIAHYGRIDILICNAGIKFEDSFHQTDVNTLHKIMDVNFMGKVLPITYALPYLKQHGGNIILISSLAGLYGLPGATIYSASKMALSAIQQGLSLELRKYGIHTGIMYVGMTENDPKSGIMNGAGSSETIPQRGFKRDSREYVAQSILKMIRRKERRRVMTQMGKALDFLLRWAPGMVRLIMKKRLSQIASML